MVTYQQLAKRPKHFMRLIGLTLPEFDEVFDKFYSAWYESERERSPREKRKRDYGGGRLAHLRELKDKLIYILIYVRIYPLLFVHGMMFNLSEGKACTWVHRLLKVLDQALGYTHRRPVRGQGKSLNQVLEEYPELRELGILTDGMERPRRRPKNNQAQTANYSGKKKRHTRKNIVIVHPKTSAVVFLGKTQEGKKHDKLCLDEEDLHCRDPVDMGTDLGFQGYKAANITLRHPFKKPKGRELTDTQKQQNHAFSSIRVKAEHAIAGVKRNHSVADIYRNFKENTDDLLINIACSLHNLRIAHRYA